MGVINQTRYYCIIVPQPTAPISIMICKLGEFQVGWNVQLSMTMKLPARYIFNSILKIAFWNNNNIWKQVIPEMTKSIRCTCVHLRVPFDHRRVTKSSRLDENYANETRGGGGRGGWPIDPSIKQSTKCGNAVQSQSSIIPKKQPNTAAFSRFHGETWKLSTFELRPTCSGPNGQPTPSAGTQGARRGGAKFSLFLKDALPLAGVWVIDWWIPWRRWRRALRQRNHLVWPTWSVADLCLFVLVLFVNPAGFSYKFNS